MTTVFELPSLEWVQTLAGGSEWVQELPVHLKACAEQWSLTLESAYPESNVSAVFAVTTADGLPAALKIQFPHPECEHEAEALKHWDGHGTVRLFAHDLVHHALLMERCEPGDPLSNIAADEALTVLTELLPGLWVKAGKPFTSLHDESLGWAEQLVGCWERGGRPFEKELLTAALDSLEALRGTQGEQVLLNQDLHGGNVLRATREPWLMIDPKPLVGEKEFSLASIVRSYEFGHSQKDVIHRLDRLTSALRLNRERARLWSFAQTLSWCFDGDRVVERHLETARWLWHAS
ncbi:MAG TPA: aminoglycoside phosphotransferase family protein [Candidatus Angelobacter sp.]